MKRYIALFVMAASAAFSLPVPAKPLPAGNVKVAEEDQTVTIKNKRVVSYGAGLVWKTKTLQGKFTCSNDTFGDPAFGVKKACYAKSPGTVTVVGPVVPVEVPPVVTPPVVAPPVVVPPVVDPKPVEPPKPSEPVAGDIVDSKGEIIASQYRAIAYDYAGPSGLRYRFGEPSTRTDFVALPLRPTIGKITYCGDNCPSTYQFGKPVEGGDNPYEGQQAAVVGRPLTNDATKSVLNIQVKATDRQTIQIRPEAIHQNNGTSDLRHEAPQWYVAKGLLSATDPADFPIVAYRGESSADSPHRGSYIATQGSATKGSALYFAGNFTADNHVLIRFPVGLVPTAIASTQGEEVVLVTLWDTVNVRGMVAVVAAGSMCNGCDPYNNGTNGKPKWYSWWGGSMEGAKPGFYDQGNIAFLKILRYVDLGSDMKAPTSIRANTGMHAWKNLVYRNSAPVGTTEVGSPFRDNRSKFLPGGEFYESYAKGGFAIVSSASESKAKFIDLKPYFTFMNGMYFSSAASEAETRKLGMGEKEWPYLPDSAMPVVVKTVDIPGRPVAVSSTQSYAYDDINNTKLIGNGPYRGPDPLSPRAWITTRDGKLLIYSVGRYAPGVKVETPSPSEIELKGTVTGLGANITNLSASKNMFGKDDTLNRQIMFTDRDGRGFGRVEFAADGNSGQIVQRISVAGFDPVDSSDADNYSTKAFITSMVSPTMKKVVSVRTGPITIPRNSPWPTCALDNPCAVPSGGERMEMLDVPNEAFSIRSSNVP